jgi:hypothetical protein
MANRIDFDTVRKIGLVEVIGSIFCIAESVHELDIAIYNNMMMISVFSSI